MVDILNTEEEEIDDPNADALSNPLLEGANSPMVIISVGADRYIGSLMDLDDNLCTIAFPLKYGEFLRPGPNGQADAHVDMAMAKIYAFLGTMGEIRIAFDTLHVLNPKNPSDVRLVEIYAKRHAEIKKHDAGQIEIKEPNRIILPGMGDIATTNRSKIKL